MLRPHVAITTEFGDASDTFRALALLWIGRPTKESAWVKTMSSWTLHPLSGYGGTVFAPVKSVRFFVFPAALPAIGMFCTAQAA